MKKFLSKEFLSLTLLLTLVSQHLIDLDYLLYPILDKFNLPLFSTILRFVLMPLLVLVIFLVFEKKKKKVFILALLYGFSLILYFYIHSKVVVGFLNRVYFTDNFVYVYFKEFSYLLTLVIPFGYIYSFYKVNLNNFNIAVPIISLTISIPTILSNLFLFGNSAYYGKTVASFFSWFNLKYDAFANNPRFYSSIFYYPEGNTLGILLVSSLPILIYLLYQHKNKFYFFTTAFHVLAMNLIGTRVGSYGSLVILVLMIFIYLFLVLVKKYQFNLKFIVMIALTLAISLTLYPFNPATAATKIDQSNNSYVAGNSQILDSRKQGLKGATSLAENSVEFRDFYIHYFEDNLFLIGYLPVGYYLYNYHYRNDPKFWVDFIFEYKLEERINARQFQEIFMNYKWSKTELKEKLFGMGWTPFMYSSTDLEKDFAIHRYSFGYVGFVLLVGYWLVLFIFMGLKIALKYENWSYEKLAYFLAFTIGLASSYVSGHGIDNLTVSIFLAFLTASLLKKLKKEVSDEI